MFFRVLLFRSFFFINFFNLKFHLNILSLLNSEFFVVSNKLFLMFKQAHKLNRRKKKYIKRQKLRTKYFNFFLLKKPSKRSAIIALPFFFLHKNFMRFIQKFKNNSSFLFHTRISAFSTSLFALNFLNFFSVNARAHPKFFFLKTFSVRLRPNQKFLRLKINKFQSVKRVERFSLINNYQFLESTKFKFNKLKNFFFWKTLYLLFFKTLTFRKKFLIKLKFKAKFICSMSKFYHQYKFVKKLKKRKPFFYILYKKILKSNRPVFMSSSRASFKFNFTINFNFFRKNRFFDKKKMLKTKRFLKKNSAIADFLNKKTKTFFKNIKIKKFKLTTFSFIFYKTVVNCLLFYESKWNIFFLSPMTGFLLTSITQNHDYLNFQNLANLKKESYSFGLRNSIEKRFLKKYFFYNNIEYYNENFSKIPFIKDKSSDRIPHFFLVQNLSRKFISEKLKTLDWGYYCEKKYFWNVFSPEELDLTIRRIRFRPGYSIIWREARSVLQHNLNCKFRYQHRLTRYLMKFKKIVKSKLSSIAQLTLVQLVTRAKFFPDYFFSEIALRAGLIFVNSIKCSNPALQVFIGDFFQIASSYKYFIVYKSLLNTVLKKKQKLDYISSRRGAGKFYEKLRRHSSWILHNKNIMEDVPKFLEADYISLSCFLIYEPFLWSDFTSLEFPPLHFLVISMYNWKYIN